MPPSEIALAPPAATAAAPARPAWLRGYSGLVFAFVLVLTLVSWLTVVGFLVAQYRETIDAATRENLNLARALEEQTLRVISATDQATIRVRDALVAAPQQNPPLVSLANETGLAPKILVQLSVIDARGRLMASNLDPDGTRTDHVDLSEREHVRAHLAPHTLGPDAPPVSANGLFIGKPVLGKVSKRWTIQISRRIAAADGTPLGVVVASLDPGYFNEVFSRVALRLEGGVTLVGSDRTVRARVIGGNNVGVGSQISAESPLAQPDVPSEGTFRGVSGVDKVERIRAYRRVADYPLFVLVSRGVEESMESWRDTRNIAVALVALLTLAMWVSAAGFGASLRRQERANEALRLSEAQAQAASQAKTEFLAAISHELRTPLTSIRGFSELLESRLDNPKHREAAALIRKGAVDLTRLVTEILDLAKAEAGAMVLSPAPMDLRPLVAEVAETFRLPAQAKGLALHVFLSDKVPQTIVADPLRLKQILSNLLSNAVKFTEQGQIEIRLACEARWLRVQVQDTGPGIPPESQALVFEKFRQGNARVSYQHGGTGLGLALSRGLAELMHGTLTLQSTVGVGSTFTLQVPLQLVPAAPEVATA